MNSGRRLGRSYSRTVRYEKRIGRYGLRSSTVSGATNHLSRLLRAAALPIQKILRETIADLRLKALIFHAFRKPPTPWAMFHGSGTRVLILVAKIPSSTDRASGNRRVHGFVSPSVVA